MSVELDGGTRCSREWTLPRTAGRGRALDMLMSAEPIDASRALAFGLVHEVVEVDRLDEVVERVALRLAGQPVEALRAAKRALVDGADLPLGAAIGLEARLRSRLINS